MPYLNLFDNLYLILGFIIPGFIVLFIRSQFVTGRSLSHSSALLTYLTVSVVYYALVLPVIDLAPSIQQSSHGKALAWFALILAGPAILGLLLGVNIQTDAFRRFLRWCGLNPVHVIPTAWDWKFGGMPEQWVLVTLRDGTRFAGFCGSDSFMSSDPEERDIYVERIYDIEEDDRWVPRGEKGLPVAASEVRTIEFWPYNPKEKANGQD